MKYSVQLGAVRITERFFKHDPPTDEEQKSARRYIQDTLATLQIPGPGNYRLIGVAGTVTSLACLEQHLNQFIPERVEGFILDRQRISYWCGKLLSMTSAEIGASSEVTEGRADILSAGCMILDEIVAKFGFENITSSVRGLRYGIALKTWEKLNR